MSVANRSALKLEIISILLLLTILSGCQKWIDVKSPSTQINGSNVYNDDITATAVMTALYTQISGELYLTTEGLGSIGKFTGLSSDELSLWSGSSNSLLSLYYTNSLAATPALTGGSEIWNSAFGSIYACNSAIEGISVSTALNSKIKAQLLGEAKFMRAFYYFYLVNLYGALPLALSSDYKENSLLSRSSVNDVYSQIIKDLKEAQELLSSKFLDQTLLKESVDRERPTKWAATAFLARVYLYSKQYQNAEAEATKIINERQIFDTASINTAFLRASLGNKEAIWQLQPVNLNWNTEEAKAYIIPEMGFTDDNPYALSKNLLDSFESGDNRKVDGNWVKSIMLNGEMYYYPYKYKVATYGEPITESFMVLRMGEVYLIRAEARAHQGKVSDAQQDLNIIRRRAGLEDTNANSQITLLSAIMHERQVELFTEWGHRWLDIKRTETINQTMTRIIQSKGGNWESYDQLYPLPLADLQHDPNLSQNSGY